MSQGVPGTPPPKVLLEALSYTSFSPGTSGYCHVLGEPTLRSAFAEEMKSVYGQDIDVSAEDIAITSGCNMAFFATVMCLADPGDEIILPVPWYVVSLLLHCPAQKSLDRYFNHQYGSLLAVSALIYLIACPE